MEKEIIVRLHKDFEQSVYRDQNTGIEFWLARNLQNLLGYTKWENFAKVIEKAKTACKNAGFEVNNHFLDIRKMVDLGSGAKREIDGVIKYIKN
jgi:DNA-damage-inducible protein D